MTTATHPSTHTQTHIGALREMTRPVHRDDTFHTVGSEHSLGENLPQRAGGRLWLPMFVLALMGWTVGMVLAIVEAATDRSEAGTLQDLSHLVPAFMFIGFLGIFSAITFAVARILGAFRRGGGDVQETSGAEVQTLRMPGTAKLMLVLMAMGMMTMGAGIVANFIAAGAFDGVSPADITDSAAWAAASSGLRRMGVALYLTGIAFGLGTIIEVLRFQSIRIREVAAAHGHDNH
jgi:hypothetical protein